MKSDIRKSDTVLFSAGREQSRTIPILMNRKHVSIRIIRSYY